VCEFAGNHIKLINELNLATLCYKLLTNNNYNVIVARLTRLKNIAQVAIKTSGIYLISKEYYAK